MLLLLAACSSGSPHAWADGPIEDLAFEPNPSNTLSVWATWTTPIPTTSVVRFGESSEPTWQIADDTLTCRHRVLVYGLREARSYEGYAVSESADGVAFTSDPDSFSAGDLPYPWLRGEVVTRDADRVQPGWTLANLATGLIGPSVLVIVDDEGEPVWYHVEEAEGFPDIQATLTDEGIAFGPGVAPGTAPGIVDLAGERVWNGPAQPDGTTEGRMSHVFQPISDGRVIVNSGETVDGMYSDVVRIYDHDLGVKFEWPFASRVDRDRFLARSEINSADLDEDTEILYLHARLQDLLFAVSTLDGGVIWTFGELGDFAPDPSNPYPWFDGAHAVKRLDDGHVLMYDNGDSLRTDHVSRGYSRAVEYALDESTMTSSILWEWPAPDAEVLWRTVAWGDADRLENGNTLVDVGQILPESSSPDAVPARIVEVAPEGEVVWDLRWDHEAGVEGSYQVERIPELLAAYAP